MVKKKVKKKGMDVLAKMIKAEAKKTKVNNSLTKKYCPFFKEKCKGLNCAFGETKSEHHYFGFGEGNSEVLYCKLFEGLTGRLRFEIETKIKQEDD